MVIEKELAPFLVWLFGPGFGEGGPQTWPALVFLAVVLLLAGGLLLAARYASMGWARVSAWLFFALAAFPPFLGAMAAAAELRGAGPAPLRLLAQSLAGLFGPQWRQGSLATWWSIIGAIVAICAVVGFLGVLLRSGPRSAWRWVSQSFPNIVVDLARMSPRRLWALAWLAFWESMRRRVIVVFVIFVLLLLVAGWYLDPGSPRPAELYLSTVFSATTYLVALLALFFSVFSLPADISNRTLHTVVTKPVRPSEIVLGRMAGFIMVGTVLLAVMSVVSFLFVERNLQHTHVLLTENLHPPENAKPGEATRPGGTNRSLAEPLAPRPR